MGIPIEWSRRENLMRYIYCTRCKVFYPTMQEGWYDWLKRHYHTGRLGPAYGDSYYPPGHPAYGVQEAKEAASCLKMSDAIIDGYTCELTPLELLALQGDFDLVEGL